MGGFGNRNGITLEHRVTLQIIDHTKNWTLSNWKHFRSLNDYWNIKDGVYKDGGSNIILAFKTQKLKWVKQFNTRNI